jgi:putative membrane protein
MLQILLAALHLVALAIGLPAIVMRATALGRVARGAREEVHRALVADSHWGVAAALWIATGLWRWLAATEKSTAYYNRNHLFLAKMAFLVVILVLEVGPMVKLIRYRLASRGAPAPEAALPVPAARRIAAVSWVQAALVVTMLFLAVSMARGLGAMPGG